MNLITALEVHGNYPENILIDAGGKDKNWDAFMYLKRDGHIHKIMLSTSGSPFKSKQEAIDYMDDLAKQENTLTKSSDYE